MLRKTAFNGINNSGSFIMAEYEYFNEIEHNPMHTDARHSIERIRRKQI